MKSGTLVDGGYQKFFRTPNGKRKPALAEELKAIQDFQEYLKEALGLTSLLPSNEVSRQFWFRTSTYTIRVEGRDPWPQSTSPGSPQPSAFDKLLVFISAANEQKQPGGIRTARDVEAHLRAASCAIRSQKVSPRRSDDSGL